MDKLKPCPFCGGEHIEILRTDGDRVRSGFQTDKRLVCVFCNFCRVVAGWVDIDYYDGNIEKAEAAAVGYWNRRADNGGDD